MRLRELKFEDAEFMLEWMQDDAVVHDLQTDFLKMTLDDCNNFISQARQQYSERKPHQLHYAITNEADEAFREYQGTVSLKNINYTSKQAEFAITIRRKAMGRDLAQLAMQEIIAMGFKKLGLHTIYWYVSPKNIRANRFYEKNGYKGMDYKEFRLRYGKKHQTAITDADPTQYIWYFVDKNDNS